MVGMPRNLLISSLLLAHTVVHATMLDSLLSILPSFKAVVRRDDPAASATGSGLDDAAVTTLLNAMIDKNMLGQLLDKEKGGPRLTAIDQAKVSNMIQMQNQAKVAASVEVQNTIVIIVVSLMFFILLGLVFFEQLKVRKFALYFWLTNTLVCLLHELEGVGQWMRAVATAMLVFNAILAGFSVYNSAVGQTWEDQSLTFANRYTRGSFFL